MSTVDAGSSAVEPGAPLPGTTAAPAAVTMEQFFTRQRANEGVELPLSLPDGTPSPHWVKIRGVDSDAFKQADAEAQRRVLESVNDLQDKSKAVAIMAEERLNVIAATVISWSFTDRPCNLANVKAFLKEAPQIAEQIDRLSTRRMLFFKLGSKSSTPSPAPSSS